MLIHGIEESIGHTPLLAATRYAEKEGIDATLFCKLEAQNPAGSIKDRTALYLLRDAEQRGILAPGATVIEPTSGNTGIGLAALCAQRGYRLILTMPDTMSVERRRLLSAYGAEIFLTPGEAGMSGAIQKAEELCAAIPGSWIPAQFDNPANPEAHEQSTARELMEDLEYRIDALVAGIGTGGTLTGIGRAFRAHLPSCRMIGVEPASSPLLTEGRAAPHGLQGIGANFIPKNFDAAVCDEVLTVSEEEAYAAARSFARTEGVLVGITSGAALAAARKLAERAEFRGKRIAVILPDGGDRYLSTPLFACEEK